MSRPPRRSLANRLAVLTAGVSLLTAAAVAASAPSASADTTINAHYALTGSTFIKKLNTTVNLGSGSLAATVDLDTGAVSSTLSLPPATVSMKELGIIPVSATATMVQNGPATGSANLTTNTITSSASIIFKITKLSVAGLNVPVGGNCESSPFSVSLSSGPGFTVSGGGPLSGSYTIPPLHGCGLITPVLNLLIPGPGNTFNLTLGPLQLG
ncbi:MAG: hypothetical protein ABSB59_15880 [Streptosporangiaceae bacterium]